MEDANHTSQALSDLTEREQRILRMRFGIGGTAEHTLEEVGEIFAVTGSGFARSRRQRFTSTLLGPSGSSR
jgi:DNA-directed RNA polymerase sigma subunit (sigma70/sigma32)